jgi:hypothetical protein
VDARPTFDCLAIRQETLMRVGLEHWLDANGRLLPVSQESTVRSLSSSYRLARPRGFWLDDSSLLITGEAARNDRLCLIANDDPRLKALEPR